MSHAYRNEIDGLLHGQDGIQVDAVFDVDGVPTVCFVASNTSNPDEDALVQAIRERAWNQNLVSIVLVISEKGAWATPASKSNVPVAVIAPNEASPTGRFSVADVQSGDIYKRHSDWFEAESRVDRKLLSNIDAAVQALVKNGLEKKSAQLLMAQILFVAYLEHRGIVGNEYRQSRQVESLFDLVTSRHHQGIFKLFECLKDDFNGDLLEPEESHKTWENLPKSSFVTLSDFLGYVDLRNDQFEFWRYDFRYIPVELISGIYESFLAEDKRDVGAYYTPRHLAVLAVDQAFSQSHDILAEKVYDGACGSGILLTTAYRRMLAVAEAKAGDQLPFAERIALLQQNIFGSDINESACRVTAFSLYLSVLENLQPADITKLTSQGESKLPTLNNRNIYRGESGDFFSDKNPLASGQKFTLFLSNPPWVEPKKKEVLSSDVWAKKVGVKLPRRQLCAAFMMRAWDAIDPVKGRICLILPVSIMAAPTSQKFIRTWLSNFKLKTVINFGDLRKVLFDNAKQPSLVVVAEPRAVDSQRASVEPFDYWAPKADVSLAFGRLTLHGCDRHVVNSAHLYSDNSILTTLFWGTAGDLSLIARLEMGGQIRDVLCLPGWRMAKGFHTEDAAVEPEHLVSAEPIAKMSHLDAKHLALYGPVLDENALFERLPEGIELLPKLGPDLLSSFDGPRIVFKDGMTTDKEVCAGYSEKPFSFTSSTGVILAPREDADVLRFLSVFLHSDLVRYLLLLSAYQISFERERVTLRNIENLPFVHPEHHSNPKKAWTIVSSIAGLVKKLEARVSAHEAMITVDWRGKAEELIGDYFDLSQRERDRIQEVVGLVIPSVQPSTLKSLDTPLQGRVSQSEIEQYGHWLVDELNAWRDAMGGDGAFHLKCISSSAQACGPMAILRLDTVSKTSKQAGDVGTQVGDAAVAAVLKKLRTLGALPVKIQDNLHLATDVVVFQGDSIYFAKPMVRRLWLQSAAFQDAERIVRLVQETVE